MKLLAQNEPDKNNWRGVIVNTAGVEGISGTKGQATSAAASGAIIGNGVHEFCHEYQQNNQFSFV